MLRSDGDLVPGTLHHLPFFPPLFVGYETSLDENVVQEDIDDNIMPVVDLSRHFPAATYDMLRVQSLLGLAAPSHYFRSLLCYQLLPLANTEEVLLDLPDNFHCFWGCS